GRGPAPPPAGTTPRVHGPGLFRGAAGPPAHVGGQSGPPSPTHAAGRAARDRPALRRPRTPLEEFLADLWHELLHVEQVGVVDNFCARRATACQVASLTTRRQARPGPLGALIALFDAPPIAGLAHPLGVFCPDAVPRAFGAESPARDEADSTAPPPEPASAG